MLAIMPGIGVAGEPGEHEATAPRRGPTGARDEGSELAIRAGDDVVSSVVSFSQQPGYFGVAEYDCDAQNTA